MEMLTRKFTYSTIGNAAATAHSVANSMVVLFHALHVVPKCLTLLVQVGVELQRRGQKTVHNCPEHNQGTFLQGIHACIQQHV